MLLVDNVKILNSKFNGAYKILEAYNLFDDGLYFELEESKKEENTLYYKNGDNKIYIHSRFDPINEANAIVSASEDKIKDGDAIIFYGTGLGYHIEAFLNKYPNLIYFVYEPIPKLAYKFLSRFDLKKYGNNCLGMIIGKINTGENLSDFIDKNKSTMQIIELQSHANNFQDERFECLNNIKNLLESKVDSISVDYNFQKRWILNSMNNFNTVLRTPNILIERNNYFVGKTALLVSAGPSLNYEIENLKKIKEDKSAYIFSVGSAINTLIYNGLYPDATLSYDPKEVNQKVIKIIKEKNIKEIPLIFGSSIGFETIEDYPGKMFNVITSQDSVSNYYLQEDLRGQIGLVQDASSIAILAIQIFKDLGFSQIVFVGQNLAYLGDQNHSEGVVYSKKITEDTLKDAIMIKDVNGNDIFTSSSYNSMRKQIEYYVEKFKEINFINTTINGANITGADFVKLEDLMENMEPGDIDDNWKNLSKTKFNLEKLDFYKRKMDREFRNVLNINKEYEKILNKIENAVVNRNYKNLEKIYTNLDKQLSKLEKNEFYKVFVLTINRVEYTALANKVDNLNRIANPREKAIEIYGEYKKFLYLGIKTIQDLEENYNQMLEGIDQYIRMEEKNE